MMGMESGGAAHEALILTLAPDFPPYGCVRIPQITLIPSEKLLG